MPADHFIKPNKKVAPPPPLIIRPEDCPAFGKGLEMFPEPEVVRLALCSCGCGKPATHGCAGLASACYQRQWHAAHPGLRAIYNRAFHKKHRARLREKNRAWQAAYCARRKAEQEVASLPSSLSVNGAAELPFAPPQKEVAKGSASRGAS
jgi:hypothetical protein